MNKFIMIFMLNFLTSFSQEKNKEVVNLFFNTQSDDTCKVSVEGKGYVNLKKYRKDRVSDIIYFKICGEKFTSDKKVGIKDICSTEVLNNTNFVDLDYLIERYKSQSKFKHNVFKKIYFYEKISENKMVKYEVNWVDQMIMID